MSIRKRAADFSAILLLVACGLIGALRTEAAVEPVATVVDIAGLTAFGSNAIFRGSDGSASGLWQTDGTSAGTNVVSSVVPFSDPLAGVNITITGGVAYLWGGTAGVDLGLWRSDGTTAGTALVKPIDNSNGLGRIIAMGDRVFMVASQVDTGEELWTSDGTEAGTFLLSDLIPGSESSSPHNFLVHDGVLYFIATTKAPPENRQTLLRTDGTTAGTLEIRKFPPTTRTETLPLTAYHGFVYFGFPSATYQTMYRTNGTPGNNEIVFGPGVTGSEVRMIVGVVNDYMILTILTTSVSTFRSDNTIPSRTLTFSPLTGDAPGVNADDKLFYPCDRWNVCVTNAFAEGTRALLAQNEIVVGEAVTQLTVLNGALYFIVNHQLDGKELWKVNVTGGTQRLTDLSQLSAAGAPVLAGGHVVFAATDKNGVTRLWTVSPGAPAAANDSASVVEGNAVGVNVLSNDTDADDELDVASTHIVLAPTNGNASVDPASGEITYTPNSGFVGTDVLHYRVRDNSGLESTDAVVTIDVTAAPAPPPPAAPPPSGGGGGGGAISLVDLLLGLILLAAGAPAATRRDRLRSDPG